MIGLDTEAFSYRGIASSGTTYIQCSGSSDEEAGEESIESKTPEETALVRYESSAAKVFAQLVSGERVLSLVHDTGSEYSGYRLESRISETGELDPSFGKNGVVDLDLCPTWNSYGTLSMSRDGAIIVGGACHDAVTWNAVILRLKANGKFDRSFSRDGIAALAPSDQASWGGTVQELEDGRILVAPIGYLMGASEGVYGGKGTAVLLPNGQLDASYGNGGVILP